VSDVESELVRRRQAGEDLVLATVIRVDGAPPSAPGEKLLLGDGTALAGTLGCSEFDAAARADAPAFLQSGSPGLRTYRHELGSIEVYLEPHLAAPLLVLLGRTPVADALARWAPEVGFRPLREVPESASVDVYAVHTDHEDPDLVTALERVLSLSPRFVGVMGSRRHTSHHLEELRRRGRETSAIRSPVGLEIGARSATEIALSILAGLVAVRSGAEVGWKDRPSG
jgi:xanthine dehydrogenase accessory factor